MNQPSTGRITPPIGSRMRAAISFQPALLGSSPKRSRASAAISAGSPMRSRSVRISASFWAERLARASAMCSEISCSSSRLRSRGRPASSFRRRLR